MLPAGHIYATPGESVVNLAHESTHGVNSRIRNAVADNATHNAFFVGGGYAFVLPEPRVPLSIVARYVPAELRGVSFSLYLLQMQSHWNDQPLYILDEWTAYTNGAAVGLEAASFGTSRPEAYELQQAIEFCGYATALLLAVERHDKAYPDRAKLAEFIGWQCGRVWGLAEQSRAMDRMRGGAGNAAAWSIGCERAMENFERKFCKER